MAKHERSERTVELLMISAAKGFAAHGFSGATLSDVSRAAGVTKGALFFHFPTKDELADAVLRRGMERLEATVTRLRSVQPCALQLIVDVTHALNRLLRQDIFLRASVRISRERTDTTEGSAGLDFYLRTLARLWELADDARSDGELPAAALTPVRTLVTAAVSGVESLTWMGTAQTETETWLSQLWQLLPAQATERTIRTTAPVAWP